MTSSPATHLGYFVSTVDVFAPAQSPPTGEVTVALQDWGAGPARTISFPNLRATSDVTTVQFDDYDPARSP
jgi:hypothetical protein